MENAHARLAPSGAKTWFLCPAKPDREAPYPDTTNEASEWGTRVHEAAACRLTEKPTTDTELLQDENAVWMVDKYEEYIYERKAALAPAAIRVETEVDPGSFIGRTDCNGTADCLIVSNSMLEVVDLKTGGWLVEPDDPQVLLYGLGALIQYVQNGKVPFDMVRLTIFQPKRPGEDQIARWVDITPEALMQWGHMEFKVRAAATDGDPAGVPSDTACKFCQAQPSCPEYQAFIGASAEALTGEPVDQDGAFDVLMSTETVDQMSVDKLAKLLDAAPLIRARLKDAEERATKLAKDRVKVPGYKLVRGKSNRVWGLEPEELVKKLKNLKLKKGEIYEEKLRSPKGIQDLGLPIDKWEKIKKLITTPEGKLTLAPESDPKPDALPPVDFEPVNQDETGPDPVNTLPDFLM